MMPQHFQKQRFENLCRNTWLWPKYGISLCNNITLHKHIKSVNIIMKLVDLFQTDFLLHKRHPLVNNQYSLTIVKTMSAMSRYPCYWHWHKHWLVSVTILYKMVSRTICPFQYLTNRKTKDPMSNRLMPGAHTTNINLSDDRKTTHYLKIASSTKVDSGEYIS